MSLHFHSHIYMFLYRLPPCLLCFSLSIQLLPPLSLLLPPQVLFSSEPLFCFPLFPGFLLCFPQNRAVQSVSVGGVSTETISCKGTSATAVAIRSSAPPPAFSAFLAPAGEAPSICYPSAYLIHLGSRKAAAPSLHKAGPAEDRFWVFCMIDSPVFALPPPSAQ